MPDNNFLILQHFSADFVRQRLYFRGSVTRTTCVDATAWVKAAWLSPERNDSTAGLGICGWFTQRFGAIGGNIHKNKVRSFRYCNTAVLTVFLFVRRLLPVSAASNRDTLENRSFRRLRILFTTLMNAPTPTLRVL